LLIPYYLKKRERGDMENVATHSRVPQIIIDLEYPAAQRSRSTKLKF
jgi:hypothetical protein